MKLMHVDWGLFMKIEVQGVTMSVLRDVEILSDIEGRYILHLAEIYAPSELYESKQA